MTAVDAGAIVCGLVASPDEDAAHFAVRRAVFVTEQGVFAGTDVDAHDARADVLHVVARVASRVVGSVRLYPLAGGLWQGDRLAVLPGWRTAGAGAPLVCFAVAAAAARGGTSMIAHVQPVNRPFFERLGWAHRGDEDYVGRPHATMTIDLSG